MVRYFVGKTEFGTASIMQMAVTFGWKDGGKRLSNIIDIGVSLTEALEFLKKKNIIVNRVFLEDKRIDKNVPRISPMCSEVAAYQKNSDSKVMLCILNEGIYEIDTKLLDDDCWDIQAFGILGCSGCVDKDKDSCYGNIVDGKNSLGNIIPIAKQIATKFKRENGVQSNIPA
jgi:hypothetical protein